jgi:hypothetical protein
VTEPSQMHNRGSRRPDRIRDQQTRRRAEGYAVLTLGLAQLRDSWATMDQLIAMAADTEAVESCRSHLRKCAPRSAPPTPSGSRSSRCRTSSSPGSQNS